VLDSKPAQYCSRKPRLFTMKILSRGRPGMESEGRAYVEPKFKLHIEWEDKAEMTRHVSVGSAGSAPTQHEELVPARRNLATWGSTPVGTMGFQSTVIATSSQSGAASV
jgi:hypothetical protein